MMSTVETSGLSANIVSYLQFLAGYLRIILVEGQQKEIQVRFATFPRKIRRYIPPKIMCISCTVRHGRELGRTRRAWEMQLDVRLPWRQLRR